MIDTNIVELSRREWRVLEALKRELDVDEVRQDIWYAACARIGRVVRGIRAHRA